ncbi:phospholipase D-like domain-containing protein [Ralstonia sp. UBA689]|uniref:phospholipase D-like domain-containing protein n=1 Tax=Ralstonia sp. UBA689 TaxID=1947373 RepID=UPI0025F13254|nr:phospholipase D-like domain-containing protein [Ralstonia sp. UBA689]
MAEHLRTQNAVDVAIDEAGRKAQGSLQWLLENGKGLNGHPPIKDAPKKYRDTDLQFFICGQKGFGAIAKDLRAAQSTVDIICWGFDPGMELEERSAGDWPRGTTYGDLLEQTAKRGVRVRLLVWFDMLASTKQNNVPGYSDAKAGPFASPYDGRKRQNYCIRWWQEHLPNGQSGAGRLANLQVVLRSVHKSDVDRLMAQEPKEEDKPDAMEDALFLFGTHHQKPILIDYAHEGGSKAVGYVMGLNSITDFWDTTDHVLDDPRRQRWTEGAAKSEYDHEYDTEKERSNAKYSYTKPYQDYACRVVGLALERLHQNFERGWNAFAPAALRTHELGSPPPKLARSSRSAAYEVQIVRTQAAEREKSIKEVYFQSTSVARNYIYIENQYFFYPEFVRHLKKERDKFCDQWVAYSGKPLTDIPKLHLFIVIPHPEDDGMIPRTFDTLTGLGHSDRMKDQADLIDHRVAGQHYEDVVDATYTLDLQDAEGRPFTVKGTHKVLDRPSVEALKKSFGLEVSVARLRTYGLDANHRPAYREIYIHSKLMIIDDVFLTMGSANLNQRSMSVDGEINVAATGLAWASDLRQRVFALHSGGKVLGTGERALVPKVFDDWTKQMDSNKLARKGGKPMQGFLLRFEDRRSTTTMHA